MRTVSFDLRIRRKLPLLKPKCVICGSFGKPSVTIFRSSILKECMLEGKNLIYPDVILRNTHLGHGTYVNSSSKLFDIYIGSYSSISSNVKIINGIHPSNFVSTYPGFYSNAHEGIAVFADDVYFEEYAPRKYLNKYATYIGNDVLVGSGAVLMEGVKISDGAIILPYAVVANDVGPYTIVGGVPAKTVKYRFESDEISLLLKSEWWNKEEVWLKDNWKSFLSVKEFLKCYD